MPTLAAPDLSVWNTWARKWRKRHPGQSPAVLSVTARRETFSARAAYYFAVRDPPVPGLPVAHPCERCGTPSYSWCEGCYCRSEISEPRGVFGTVCSACDSLSLVCGHCITSSVTWDQGHAAYLEQSVRRHGEASQAETQIEITQIDGSPVEPSSFVSLEALAERSGIPAEEILRQLQAALSGSESSTRGERPADGTGH